MNVIQPLVVIVAVVCALVIGWVMSQYLPGVVEATAMYAPFHK